MLVIVLIKAKSLVGILERPTDIPLNTNIEVVNFVDFFIRNKAEARFFCALAKSGKIERILFAFVDFHPSSGHHFFSRPV